MLTNMFEAERSLRIYTLAIHESGEHDARERETC